MNEKENLEKEKGELEKKFEESTESINELINNVNIKNNNLSDSVISNIHEDYKDKNDIKMGITIQQNIIEVLNKKYIDEKSKAMEYETTLRRLNNMIFKGKSLNSFRNELSESVSRGIDVLEPDSIIEKINIENNALNILNKKYIDKKNHIEELVYIIDIYFEQERNLKETTVKFSALFDQHDLLKIEYSSVKKLKEEINENYLLLNEEKKRLDNENSRLINQINEKNKELQEIRQSLFNSESNNSQYKLSESVMNQISVEDNSTNNVRSKIEIMKETIDVLNDKNKEKKDEITKLVYIKI